MSFVLTLCSLLAMLAAGPVDQAAWAAATWGAAMSTLEDPVLLEEDNRPPG